MDSQKHRGEEITNIPEINPLTSERLQDIVEIRDSDNKLREQPFFIVVIKIEVRVDIQILGCKLRWCFISLRVDSWLQ